MKKIIYTVSAIVLSATFAIAQTADKKAEKSPAKPAEKSTAKPAEKSAVAQPAEKTATAQPVANTSLAEMAFEKDVHDFGTLEYEGNGTYEFKFTNTGKEPLIISDAKGSCGCTVPTYPKNIPIKPGETQVIKVTYDTKRPGAFTKTVTINSNAKTPQKVITIKGTVQAKAADAFPVGKQEDGGAIPYEKH